MAALLAKLVGAAHSPIGIDAGARHVKAVQLRRVSGGRWAVAAAASLPRTIAAPAMAKAETNPVHVTTPLTGSEVRRLSAALRRQGFTGDEVVVAVPSSRLLTCTLELPPRSSNAPVDQIARTEFARTHKLPADPPAFEFAHWDLPAPARAGRSTQAMTVGCTHPDADAVLQPFEEDGLAVVALDVESWALARACAPLLAEPGRVTALLDLGWNAWRLVVVHHAGVCYTRLLTDAALRHLHNALAQQLGLDAEVTRHVLEDVSLWNATRDGQGDEDDPAGVSSPAPVSQTSGTAADVRRIVSAHFETMVAELRTSFSYVAHQYPDAPLQSLLITGGGAAIPGVAEYLETALGIAARTASPADVLPCSPSIPTTPSHMTALGLALYSET